MCCLFSTSWKKSAFSWKKNKMLKNWWSYQYVNEFLYKDDINTLIVTSRYKIDRKTDPGHRFTVSPDCEVKVRRGLDGETLDREALEGRGDENYEVHILAVDKGG